MNYTALYFSPMIPSYHLPDTVQFFREVLHFTPVMDTPQYAILQKDHLTVHLLPAGPDIGQMECYLEVDDVDTIWRQIEPAVKNLPVRPPFDREYGMREIHLSIPATRALLFIGQEISPQE